MANAVKRRFLLIFFFSAVFARGAFSQDAPVAPEPEKTLIPINNGAPIPLILARPVDVSKSSDADFSWFSAFALEYLVFRLDAVSQFQIVSPDTLSSNFHEYLSFNQAPPSRQSYISVARKFNASFVLYPDYKIEKKSKTLQFSLTLQSIDNDDKRVLCSSSCDVEKCDEGLDSCISQLITGAGIAPENYTAKFLRTKIVGLGKCDRLIGTSMMASNKSSGQNHLKIAEDLKKCIGQEQQSYLAYYLGSLEYAKAASFENAALLMKDLIFRLGPTYPNLYPLGARYFRLAEKNENALQMVKVCEGLGLKTNSLVMEKALILEAMDDWENGEKAYEEVMTIDAGNFNALLFLMRKYNKDQKATEALKLSQIFEAKYSGNGRGYLEKGKSLLILKQTKEAQSALSRAAGLMPDNIEPRMLLGDSYMQGNDFNAALKQYTKIMELSPQNLDAHLKAAQSYTLLGNPRAALETLKKISAKYYDNPVVQKEIGIAEFQTGDTAAAKRDLNRFAQSGEQDLNAFLALGRIYDGLGEYRQALGMYEKALPLDENKSMAQRRIDMVRAKMGGASVKDEPNPLAGTLQGTTGIKGGSRFTLQVITVAACIGGFVGGYLLNRQIGDAQSNYNANQNPARMGELRNDLESKNKLVPFRNGLYGLGLLSAVGFSLTIVIK